MRDWPEPEGKRTGPSDPNVLRQSFKSILASEEAQTDIDWMLRQHICSGYCLSKVGSKRRREDGTVKSDMACRFFGMPKQRMGRVPGKKGFYILKGDRPGAKHGRLYKNHKGVLTYQMPYQHSRLLAQPSKFIYLWGAIIGFSPILTMDDPGAPCHSDTAKIAGYIVKYDCWVYCKIRYKRESGIESCLAIIQGPHATPRRPAS